MAAARFGDSFGGANGSPPASALVELALKGTQETSVKEGPSGARSSILKGSQTWAGRRSAEPNGQQKRRLGAGGNAHYAEISGTLKAPMPRRITAEVADIESDFI